MAYRSLYFRRDDGTKLNRYFIFDTEAEMLTSTLIVGDLAYAVDTRGYFVADSTTTWKTLTVAAGKTWTITHGSEESNSSRKELGPGNKSSGSNATSQCPIAMKMGHLLVSIQTAPGEGNSWVFTLMKNEEATSVTCTIADTDTYASDLTNTATFAAGDTWYVEMAENGTANSSNDTTFLLNCWEA